MDDQAFLKNLVDVFPNPVLIMEPTGHYLWANLSACTLYGVTLDKLVCQTEADFFTPEESTRLDYGTQTVYTMAQAWSALVPFCSSTGEITPFLFHKTLLVLPSTKKVILVSLCKSEMPSPRSPVKNEPFFQTLLEVGQDWLWEIDLNFRFVYNSPQVEKILGHPPQSLRSYLFFDLLDPSCIARIQHVFLALGHHRENALAKTIEICFKHRNQYAVYAEVTILAILDENRHCVGYRGAIHDVTHQRQSEKTLRAQLDFIQLVIDTLPQPVFFKDNEGVYLGCNHAFCDILGVKDAEELIGKDTKTVWAHDDIHEIEQHDAEILVQKKTLISVETQLTFADKIKHYVLINKAPFFDVKGRVAGIVGVITDMTTLANAKKMISEKTNFLEKVIENLPIGIFAKDPNQNLAFTIWNAHMEKIFGVKREEILGKTDFDLFENKEEAHYYQEIDQAVMGDAEIVEIPEEYVSIGNSYIISHTRKVPIFNKNGEPEILLGILQDITERRRTEAELEKHREHLEELVAEQTGALREAKDKAEATAKSLAETEMKFRSIVEQSLVGIYIFQQDHLVYVNPGLRKLLGYTNEELLYQDIRPYIHPASRRRVVRYMSKQLRGQQNHVQYTLQIQHKKGHYIDLEVYGSVVTYNDEQALIGVTLDTTERNRIENELRASEQRFKILVEQAFDGFYLHTLDTGRFLEINQTACEQTGYGRDELLQLSVFDVEVGFSPQQIEALFKNLNILQMGTPLTIEGQMRHKKGQHFPIEVRTGALILNGQRLGLSLVRDITERKLQEARLKAIFENAAIGIALIDSQGYYIQVNQHWAEMLGYSVQELLKIHSMEITHPEDVDPSLEFIRQMRTGEIESYRFEKRFYRKDRSTIWCDLSVTPIYGPDHTLLSMVGLIVDITERKSFEQRIHYLAYHDSLTSLPNRLNLQEKITEIVQKASSENLLLAILFLDLDRFKTINDSLGHDIGDTLLRMVSNRIQSCLGPHDLVARQGGDEFIIVLTHPHSEEEISIITQHLIESISSPYYIDVHQLHVTSSIGISLFPQDGMDASTLIRHADSAMYHAKEAGRDGYAFFTSEMNAKACEALVIGNNLRRAIENQEFLVYYQPQVDFYTGEIVGAEALIRWYYPDVGWISPAKFIPIAEDNGLIAQIGEWVLRTACRQNKHWQDLGLPKIPIAVNLSGAQCRHVQIGETVENILKEIGLDPHYLELELTEGVIMHDTEWMINLIHAFKDRGIQISIDDFGTGYSSLSYLKHFDVDKLKIDQSFVRDIGKDPDDEAIINAIVSIAKSLKLKVIAEGVETIAQLQYLKHQGCDEMQGYYFSKPVPPEEFQILLFNRKKLSFI